MARQTLSVKIFFKMLIDVLTFSARTNFRSASQNFSKTLLITLHEAKNDKPPAKQFSKRKIRGANKFL